jgi:hypothetical protein
MGRPRRARDLRPALAARRRPALRRGRPGPVWFAGLLIWRQLIVGELAAHRDAAEAARVERRAAAEAAQAAAVAAREQRA